MFSVLNIYFPFLIPWLEDSSAQIHPDQVADRLQWRITPPRGTNAGEEEYEQSEQEEKDEQDEEDKQEEEKEEVFLVNMLWMIRKKG